MNWQKHSSKKKAVTVSPSLNNITLLTLSAHAREGYSSHFVTLSVCHFSILEKAPFSGLKLTSIRSR